mmetsp:Transcript_19744/g.62811  ORF Transcript_19744/g.62811 Transcript_19744/m.62811 type:complete len:287 (+) Transcript_19744:202-1062(+)
MACPRFTRMTGADSRAWRNVSVRESARAPVRPGGAPFPPFPPLARPVPSRRVDFRLLAQLPLESSPSGVMQVSAEVESRTASLAVLPIRSKGSRTSRRSPAGMALAPSESAAPMPSVCSSSSRSMTTRACQADTGAVLKRGSHAKCPTATSRSSRLRRASFSRMRACMPSIAASILATSASVTPPGKLTSGSTPTTSRHWRKMSCSSVFIRLHVVHAATRAVLSTRTAALHGQGSTAATRAQPRPTKAVRRNSKAKSRPSPAACTLEKMMTRVVRANLRVSSWRVE